MTLAKLAVALGLDARGYHRGLVGAQAAAGRFDRSVGRLGHGLRGATGRLMAFGKQALFVGTIALAALVAGVGGVVNAAVEWNDAFAGVRKTVEATDSQLAQLETGLRRMATEIPVAAGELARIAEQAGALGIATDNIEEFTRVAALIGVTTNVSSEQAATALGQLSNVLDLTQDDYERFASTLVDLGNKGASTEEQILGIASRSGAAAKLIGFAADQTLAWASAVANLGIEVEAGGSSLQTFYLKVLQFVGAGDEQLMTLAKTAGLTGKQFKKLFEKDASAALQKFLAGLGRLKSAEQIAVLKLLKLSDIRVTRTLLGLANNQEMLTQNLEVGSKAWEENIALQVEAEKRFGTVASQLQILRNNINDAGISLGTALLPVISPLIAKLTDWLRANEPLINSIGLGLAGAIGTVVGFLFGSKGSRTGGAGQKGLIPAIGAWIEQNRPLIDSLTGLVSHVLGKVVPALFGEGGLVPSLVAVGRTIFDYVIPKVAAFVSNLTDKVVPSVLNVAGPVLGGLFDAFGSIVTALFGGGRGSRTGGRHRKGLIPALGDFAGALWGGGKSGFAKAVTAAGAGLTTIFEFAGKIVDALSGLVSWITSNKQIMAQLDAQFSAIAGNIDSAVEGVRSAVYWLGRLADWVSTHTRELGILFKIATFQPGSAAQDLLNLKGKQHGGPVFAGQPYLVGEKGPELMVPRISGTIVPTEGLGGGARQVSYNINVSNPEPRAAEEDIARMLRRMSHLGLAAG